MRLNAGRKYLINGIPWESLGDSLTEPQAAAGFSVAQIWLSAGTGEVKQ